MKKLFTLIACCCMLFCVESHAQITFETRVVASNLYVPWELIYGPDDYIYFTQRPGYICRVHAVDGAEPDTLLYEANCFAKGEGGMLGLALHPDFPATPYVYAAYNYNDDDAYKERIVRYTMSAGVLGSPLTLLEDIKGSNNHNGCRLLIWEDKLYITTGDAEVPAVAQNETALNGKVLRMNLDGTVPDDNPVAGSLVWSSGHRNAQGLTIAGGKLYSSEHGPGNDDELNLLEAGRNYGWPNVEGFCDESGEMDFCEAESVMEPLIAWTPTIAVSGTEYYNGEMFPDLSGKLLMCTLKDQSLYMLTLSAGGDTVTDAAKIAGVDFGRLRDICFSPSGRIFLSTSNSTGGVPADRIIELFSPDAAAIHEPKAGHIKVYPQPATDMLHVTLEKAPAAEVSYVLQAMDGRPVLQGSVASSAFDIPMQQLSPGVYILLLSTDGKRVFQHRIVKQ